jgi:pimeloyl-ACP methyl ester carboxylesterase
LHERHRQARQITGRTFYVYGKQAAVLNGKVASKFLKDISSADSMQAQLVMARVTGHFKHGNEN